MFEIQLGRTLLDVQTHKYRTIYDILSTNYYSSCIDYIGQNILTDSNLATRGFYNLGVSNSADQRPMTMYPISGRFELYINVDEDGPILGRCKYEGIRNTTGSITVSNGFMGIYYKNEDNKVINSIRIKPAEGNIKTGTFRIYGKD